MSGVKGQKRALPLPTVILYGAGGLAFSTEVAFLLLFPLLFAHVSTVLLLVCLTLGIALSVLVMPLCYAAVNGNTAIGTGRYHLALAVSALVSAASFMLMFAVDGDSAAVHVFTVTGLAFIHSVAAQIFAYTFFAIGIRFDRSGKAVLHKFSFSLSSVLFVALLIILLFDGTRRSVGAIMACASIVSVLALAAVYFSTVRSMPAFIRLEPRHKRSFKSNYVRFTECLGYGAVKLFVLGKFLTFGGIALCGAMFATIASAMNADAIEGYGVCALVSAVFAVGTGITSAQVKKFGADKRVLTAVISSAVAVAFSIGLSVILGLQTAKSVSLPLVYAYCAFCGIAVGASVTGCRATDAHARRISGCTPGKYYTLGNCAAVLGLALGVALSCGVLLILGATSYSAGVTVACCVFASMLSAGAALCKVGLKMRAEQSVEE